VKRQQITVDAAVGHSPNQIEANVQFLHTNFCRHANMAYLLLLWATVVAEIRKSHILNKPRCPNDYNAFYFLMGQYSDPARCSNFTGIEGIRE
jgi:hypothetical protein